MADELSDRMFGLRQRLISLPRRTKRWVMVLADVVAIPVCFIGAVWLTNAPLPLTPKTLATALGIGVLTLPLFRSLGLYRSVVRFMGLDLVVATAKGIALLAAVVLVFNGLLIGWIGALKLSAVLAALGMVYLAGSRFSVRL